MRPQIARFTRFFFQSRLETKMKHSDPWAAVLANLPDNLYCRV